MHKPRQHKSIMESINYGGESITALAWQLLGSRHINQGGATGGALCCSTHSELAPTESQYVLWLGPTVHGSSCLEQVATLLRNMIFLSSQHPLGISLTFLRSPVQACGPFRCCSLLVGPLSPLPHIS